ncbi:MAG: leucine-rich repeat domain-containing protein, partial [Candidatus Bipolaricaulota bacterium]
MSKVKVPLIALLVISLALFVSRCDIVDSEIPDDGSDDNGSDDNGSDDDVTDPSYFEFNKSTNTITGFNEDGPSDVPTDVVIPSDIDGVDVKEIGDEAFDLEDHMTLVEIPDTVTVIGDSAFRSNKLTSVDLGEGVEEIGSTAFQNNSLDSVEVPNSVKVIEEKAFQHNSLESVVLGDGVEEIGGFAFGGDNSVTYVEIGEGVDLNDNEPETPFDGN